MPNKEVDQVSQDELLWNRLFAELDAARESGSLPFDEAMKRIFEEE